VNPAKSPHLRQEPRPQSSSHQAGLACFYNRHLRVCSRALAAVDLHRRPRQEHDSRLQTVDSALYHCDSGDPKRASRRSAARIGPARSFRTIVKVPHSSLFFVLRHGWALDTSKNSIYSTKNSQSSQSSQSVGLYIGADQSGPHSWGSPGRMVEMNRHSWRKHQ